MTAPVVACDFDDVLFDFNRGFCAFHNERYGTTVAYEDIYTFDMQQVWQLSPEDILTRVHQFYHSPGSHWTPPIPGSVEALHQLRKTYSLEIVTSRSQGLQQVTQEYVDRFVPDTFKRIHVTNGFGGTEGASVRTKSEVCVEIGAVLLIEDAPKHAEEVASKGIPVLMPDRPWNRDRTPEGVTRFHSWDEAVSLIEDHRVRMS